MSGPPCNSLRKAGARPTGTVQRGTAHRRTDSTLAPQPHRRRLPNREKPPQFVAFPSRQSAESCSPARAVGKQRRDDGRTSCSGCTCAPVPLSASASARPWSDEVQRSSRVSGLAASSAAPVAGRQQTAPLQRATSVPRSRQPVARHRSEIQQAEVVRHNGGTRVWVNGSAVLRLRQGVVGGRAPRPCGVAPRPGVSLAEAMTRVAHGFAPRPTASGLPAATDLAWPRVRDSTNFRRTSRVRRARHPRSTWGRPSMACWAASGPRTGNSGSRAHRITAISICPCRALLRRWPTVWTVTLATGTGAGRMRHWWLLKGCPGCRSWNRRVTSGTTR